MGTGGRMGPGGSVGGMAFWVPPKDSPAPFLNAHACSGGQEAWVTLLTHLPFKCEQSWMLALQVGADGLLDQLWLPALFFNANEAGTWLHVHGVSWASTAACLVIKCLKHIFKCFITFFFNGLRRNDGGVVMSQQLFVGVVATGRSWCWQHIL